MSGDDESAEAGLSQVSSRFLQVQTTTDARAEEWLLTFKLPASGYQALADFIARSHSYDEPEIIATPIVAGSEGFLSWIEEETLKS